MEPFSPDTRHAILRNPTGSRFLAQDQRATHTPTAPVSSAPNQPAPPPTSSVYHSARAGSSPPPVPSLSPPGWSSSPDSSWTNVSPSPSGAPNLHQHTNLGDRVMDYPMELRDLSLLSSAPIVREVFELQHLRESASAAATSAAERAEYWFAQANALRREAAEVDNHATCLRAQADHDRTMFFRQRAAPAAHQAHVFGQSDDSSSEATDASDGAASSASERSSIFDQAPHVPEISALPTGLVSDRRANDPFAHEMSRYAERLRESDVWHARASRMFHEVDDLTRRAFEAREAATIMRQQVHEIEGVLRAHLQMLGVPIAVATGRTHGQGVPAAVATGRSHGQGVLDMAPRSNEWLRNNVPPAPRPAFAQLAHVPAPPAHNTSRGVNSGHAHPAAAPSGIPTMTSPIPHGPGYGHTQIRGDASAFYPQYQGTTMAMHGGPVAPPGNRGSFYNVGHPLAAVQNPSTANSAYAAYGYNARVTTAHPRRQAAASEMPGSPMGLLGHAYPAVGASPATSSHPTDVTITAPTPCAPLRAAAAPQPARLAARRG